MPSQYDADDQRIADRFDRDIENEGLGRYTPFARRRVTLIPKATPAAFDECPSWVSGTTSAGVLQPQVPIPPPTKAAAEVEDAPKVVREMPLDGTSW